MKYIITESKLEKVIIKYLNKFYGDLEEYRTDLHPERLFFVKDDKVYMEQDLKRERLFVNYDTIWSDLKTIFNLENPEIVSIISKWVEDTYKLSGFTRILFVDKYLSSWERLFN